MHLSTLVFSVVVALALDVYGPPSTITTIKEKSISESSGLVASRSTPGVYWTHNDSGDGPFIYAFDTHGDSRGIFRVTGAQARDWEDIAAGPGPQANKSYLYIGDIGDNNKTRDEVIVYRVAEPTLNAATQKQTKARPGSTGPQKRAGLNILTANTTPRRCWSIRAAATFTS